MAKGKGKGKKGTQECEFTVEVEALHKGLDRCHQLLNTDGIPIQDQKLAFRTDMRDDTLVLCGGYQGTYVEVDVPCEVTTKGYFVTNIAIPWLNYGSAKVSMKYNAAKRCIEYKGRIKGTFVTTGKFETIMESQPKKQKPTLKLPFAALHEVVSTVFFNASVLEEQEDVLILLECTELAKPKKTKGKKIKRKAKDKEPDATHELIATVFDRARAAVVKEYCTASKAMDQVSFGSGHLWTFLTKCTSDERKGDIAITINEDFCVLQTPNCISVTPSIENELGDMTKQFLSHYKDEDALFSFELDTDEHSAPVVSVLSVRGGPRTKLSTGSDETASDVALSLQKGKITLSVRGEVGSGKVTFKPLSSSGSGKIILKGTFLVEAMELVSPAKAQFTVWSKMVRQVAVGRHYAHHYFATVKDRS